MHDQPDILTISISGSAGEHRRSWRSPAASPPSNNDKTARLSPEEAERANIQELNAKSGEICTEIERQIKKLVGPEISVQAEMSFSPGSIVIEGTIILLCWSGSLVLEAVNKEIADLVRVPIKRVLAEVLTSLGGNALRLEVETAVRSRSVVRAPAMALPAADKTAAVVQLPTWRNLALAVITLGIVFLVADRLFSEWPNRTVVVATAPH